MSFWSGERLLDLVDRLEIVRPFDPSKIDCSAYTLTLGREAFVSPDFDVKTSDIIKKNLYPASKEHVGSGWRDVGGEDLVIPPGQFAYLLTEEFIRIPWSAMGFISLKFG